MPIDDRKGRDGLKDRGDTSPLTSAAPGDDGVRGAPYGNQGAPEEFVYGEPKGPRPPHFEILPKSVIEAPPSERAPSDPSPERYEAPDRETHGFVGGLSTPETYRTTGDQTPAEVRRDLPTFRRETEERDDERTDR
ncbi:hypothetical protein [Chthonobacter rhizosphaerae]|uniref:hypothetical protein n=1 Tax=Chthonobacter rhizosphaerae TaxID=2735553 RepID=UPI0015EF38C9|nr:hypothetical protein [Chthonobacter rhizosphaerae]